MKNKKNTLYYIIAGEASGDLHGHHLMKELHKKDPNLVFRGIGGPKMEEAGLSSLIKFNRLAVMGFIEVLKDLFFFINTKKTILKDIKLSNPDKIILIDYPGFNLSLAKSIKKKLTIPIIFYISPQVWAWKETRVATIKKYIDSLIVIFPFEVEWFKKRGVEVNYFGHPLIDINKDKPIANKTAETTVGLFPGSREQEIARHLPLLKKTIQCLLKHNPKIKFIVCQAPGLNKETVNAFSSLSSTSIMTKSRDVFALSSAAIVTSGTATLECAIAKTPFVVIYKTSLISWLLAKYFLSIKYVSIVNIIANQKIVTEFLQHRAQPQIISKTILGLIKKPNALKQNLSLIKNSLGSGNSYKRTAQYILKS